MVPACGCYNLSYKNNNTKLSCVSRNINCRFYCVPFFAAGTTEQLSHPTFLKSE